MLAFFSSILHDPLRARIQIRHKTFWHNSEAENVRNTLISPDDPLEKWKNVEFWQRRLSNKLNSRNFALANNCKVPELYWKGRDLGTIDFNKLPENYVIRPTIGHSSKLVFLMKNGTNLFDNKTYSPVQLKSVLQNALDKNVALNFLIEEFLTNEQGEQTIQKDYKLFCFNGEIAFINVINRFSPNTGNCTTYNQQWEQLKPITKNFPEGPYSPPPMCLSEMILQAKKLSQCYEIFVRIDFYATDRGAVFGEFTPTPCMGIGYTHYGQKVMLDYWDKYCAGKI